MSNTDFYLEDFDLVWVGRDIDNRIGVFVTGGKGAVPALVAASLSKEDIDMEVMLNALPTIASVSHDQRDPAWSHFQNLVSRGMFVFDWGKISKFGESGYKLIARPTSLLHIDELKYLLLWSAPEKLARSLS